MCICSSFMPYSLSSPILKRLPLCNPYAPCESLHIIHSSRSLCRYYSTANPQRPQTSVVLPLIPSPFPPPSAPIPAPAFLALKSRLPHRLQTITSLSLSPSNSPLLPSLLSLETTLLSLVSLAPRSAPSIPSPELLF